MKLEVLGTAYELLITEEMPDGILGLCDSEAKTIKVRKGLPKARMMATLLHEFIHACDFENGVYQAVGPQIMEITAETNARALLKNFEIRFKSSRREKKPKAQPRRAKRQRAGGQAR